MSGLMEEMAAKASRLNIPLNVQLDLTYRCNERCVHCYLDHHDHGEMSTAEIKHLLDEMAEAGVFILTLSGGEIFLRKDFFAILEHARRLMFCVRLKTNAVLIRERDAARLRELAVESIQVSIYSHRPEVHDSITLLRGSLKRSLDAIRFLKAQGLRVIMANVLMLQNMRDYTAVRALAEELGVGMDAAASDGILVRAHGPLLCRSCWYKENWPCNAEHASRPPMVTSAMSTSSVPYLQRSARMISKRHPAAQGTQLVTSRLMVTFSLACSFLFPQETSAASASLTSGVIHGR